MNTECNTPWFRLLNRVWSCNETIWTGIEGRPSVSQVPWSDVKQIQKFWGHDQGRQTRRLTENVRKELNFFCPLLSSHMWPCELQCEPYFREKKKTTERKYIIEFSRHSCWNLHVKTICMQQNALRHSLVHLSPCSSVILLHFADWKCRVSYWERQHSQVIES